MAPGSDISLADTSFPSPVPAFGFFFWSLQNIWRAASAFPFFPPSPLFVSSPARDFSPSVVGGLGGPLLSLVAGDLLSPLAGTLAKVVAGLVTGESSSLSKVGCCRSKVVGPDLEEDGEEGLLSIGESGEDVSLDGNRLLMLNLPKGDTCGLAAVAGLVAGRAAAEFATKFPFTNCSSEPRMEAPPSAGVASFCSALAATPVSLAGEPGSEVGVFRKRGLPTHC